MRIQPRMTCLERERLQALTLSIENDLDCDRLSPSTAQHDDSPILQPVERALRTALFSSQIDLAFHRARCLICKTMDDCSGTTAEELLRREAA